MKRMLAVITFMILVPACNGNENANETVLTGSVESDTVRISSLVGGRLTEVNAVEGMKVKVSAVIARIDTTDYELQLKQADTGVRAAAAQLTLVKKGVRREDLAAAKELVNQTGIGVEKFKREYQRVSRLKADGAATDKELDDIVTQRDQAKSQLEQAKRQYEKARNGARKEEIDAAKAASDQTLTTIDILNKKIADCTVLSPRNGTVLHRLAEPGEVVSPGSTIAIISDLATVKIIAFVPERDLGLVTLGMQATLRVDSFPEKQLIATVSRIADEAEFTPKTIQTKEERVKTVYRVELTAENSAGIFKPGMPVDVVFTK